MSKSEAKKIVKKYVEKLKEENFPFVAVYLFGSHATGRADQWSDIDIAVISDRFQKNWNKNEELLWKLTATIDPRIEPVGITKKDFDEEKELLVSEIKKDGLRIEI